MTGGGGGSHTPQPMPSPALQPYYGTYQSISPLPSPTLPPHQSSSQIYTTIPPPSPLIPSSRESSPEPTPSYDPTNDAKAILQQLKSTFSRPSPRPLIKILPTLTPPQLNMLRREYKQLYRGVNLAKHLKAVFTTSSPFGKIIFAVALGPYESEAWFANSWYQKKETRNELLIESLMGRTNPEIGNIKAAFKDAKYDASLEKAVQTELHSNKFRLAVMMQLSCTRMEDGEQLNTEKIHDDVARLGNILERRKEGGETEMVEIIINRSDPWLREIAATYRRVYERDLMKAIMKRSKNLVGETLLHVLNGAVDKPLRDAKLLDQAITAVLEENREDLLISRATRIHWDPKHLELVKRAFRKKYRKDLGVRIKEAARGSYQDFLLRMVRE
ncbi:hypothetical protein EDC01DRAFT_742697 [Geopyxis carbonaria]|nr:hypothetical protein EDC01DRAFT_742697 [Geopyxis carbonaria]